MNDILVIILIAWSFISAYKIVMLEFKLSRLTVFFDGFMELVIKKGGDKHE